MYESIQSSPRECDDTRTGGIGVLINEAHKRWPDRVAVVDPETGHSMNYFRLVHRARGVADWLNALGLREGGKVAFAAGNSVTALELLCGALYGKFIPVPCNPGLGAEQLTHVVGHCDAEVLFASRENAPALASALHCSDRQAKLVEVGNELQLSESETPPATGAADDDAIIVYTSGTTGQPKGVLHSVEGLLASIENTATTYALSKQDRFLCVLPVHHGNSINKILATWMTGGTVVLPPRFEVRRFWHWVDDLECSWLALVPSIISQLLKFTEGGHYPSVRFARSSSAPLPPAWHREFERKFGIPLLEGMGSTEAGPLFSSPLPPASRKIGSPGKNVIRQEVKIVDEQGAELEENETGAIVVRGPSRMKGYYKDAAATSGALTADGFFRTGDIGYRDPDGFFFVTGRAKEIVIKAGVNIALREIDEVLLCHTGVADAASAGIEDPNLGEDIAAYVVPTPGGDINVSDLLDFFVDKAGAFKAPATILQVPEIPRLPNGKVQRYLLRERFGPNKTSGTVPGPRASENEQFVAPRTPMEIIMADVWSEYLSPSSVGIHDDFFALGGYSLLAISMLTPLRRRIGTPLSLSTFFDSPNIAEQAVIATSQLLRQLSDSERGSLLHRCAKRSCARNEDSPGAMRDIDIVRALDSDERAALEAALFELPTGKPPEDRIPQRPAATSCPLSYAQERIWFMGKMAAEPALYNTGDAVRLGGPLDVDALERAVNVLVDRHEILRCAISVVDGQPRQWFRERLNIRVDRRELEGAESTEQEAALRHIVMSEIRRPYRLDEDPLIRAITIRLGREDHVFILCRHHLVSDGWSTRTLLNELGLMYRDEVGGGKAGLPELPIQYGDFAVWQRQRLHGERRQHETEYWLHRLKGVPLVLDLPTDKPRPTVLSYQGHRLEFELGNGLSDHVYAISKSQQVSPFTTLAAAFAALIFRYTAQQDFVIGLPFADRDRTELQYLVGILLDTHIIRFSLSGRTRFDEALAQTRAEVAETYAHRELPFELVVDAVQPRRDPGRTPLCQVLVNWRESATRLSSLSLEGTTTRPLLSHDGTAKFDLSMTFTESDVGLGFEIEYSTDLFEAATIERMAGHFRVLLEAALDNPTCPIGELPLLTADERRRILFDWNDTTVSYPGPGTLHELFEEQVARTPEAIAIEFSGTHLNYRQLNEQANRLAGLLQTYGAGPEKIVAVMMDRSIDMVTSLCAAFKSGGAYLPLDPTYPAERIAFMIEETQPSVILTQRHLRERLPTESKPVIVVEDAWPETVRFPSSNPASKSTRGNAAYVIYTSGSTGRPKGVINTHAGIVNRLQWMREYIALDASDRVMQKTPLTFDVSVWEIFWPLLVGAQLVIAKPDGHRDPGYLVREVVQRGITTMHFVPSMLRLFLEHPESRSCTGLKRVICSGEALPCDLQERFFSTLTADLYNLYGPTEAAVEVTAWQCHADRDSRVVPIGHPVPNTQIRIVNAGLQPVPVGVAGELLIGGTQVARGYVARPELTADRFIEDPFSGSGTLYRTGDLARWLPDGSIEYLGRMDTQLKLRGIRIEPGEIETALNRHEQVQTCAVMLHEDTMGDRRIIAYVVPAEGATVDEAGPLRAHLKASLPEYMIPAIFIPLAALPLTTSGKLERHALPAPDPGTRAAEGSPAAPRTETEQLLARIWAELLGLNQIGVHDNFFDLGGHSLLAARVVNRMNDALGIDMTLVQIFETPTVAEIAKAVETTGSVSQQQTS